MKCGESADFLSSANDRRDGYLVWLEWADGRISFIRDYRYVRYVVDDAELVLAPEIASPDSDQ